MMIYLSVGLTLAAFWLSNTQGHAMAAEDPCRMIADFADPQEIDAWYAVNDTVMGGRSSAGPQGVDGALVFSGTLITQGGGFASTRRDITQGRLENARTILIRYRGDGRPYAVSIQTGERSWRRPISFRASFDTQPGAGWQEARLPIADFTASSFGQPLPGRSLDPAKARTLGVFLNDGQDGPFRLEVAWIKACF